MKNVVESAKTLLTFFESRTRDFVYVCVRIACVYCVLSLWLLYVQWCTAHRINIEQIEYIYAYIYKYIVY